MPGWGDILVEIGSDTGRLDIVRRKYLVSLHQKTGRPTILYASRWLTPLPGADVQSMSVSLADIQGLMEVMRGVQGTELDLIIHSPGGSIDAADAFVKYLRSKFTHIRAIVPHAAMSAACMIACSADEILMGKHSFLGPFDPQLYIRTQTGERMVPAQAIIEQFRMAQDEIKKDPSALASWVPMLSQYGPDLLVLCKNASELSETLVQGWLTDHMFQGDKTKAKAIASWLSTHGDHLSHGRPIGRQALIERGLKVTALEDDQELQDLVLSVYHAMSFTFSMSPLTKIIENHLGRAMCHITTGMMAQGPGRAAFSGLQADLSPVPLLPQH